MSKYKESIIEDKANFKTEVMSILSKLNNPDAVKVAEKEMKSFVVHQVKDGERLQILINSISEENAFQKVNARKDQLKLFIIIAEVFQFQLIEYQPKIFMVMNKKIKDGDKEMYQAIADTYTGVLEYALKNISQNVETHTISECLKNQFEIVRSGAQASQIGASLCVSKIIQSSPINSISTLFENTLNKIQDNLRLDNCKCVCEMLECLLSLLLTNQLKVSKYADIILPVLNQTYHSQKWNVRKVAVDALYSLCIICPNYMKNHKMDLIESINPLKVDKNKNVREAAMATLNALKDLPGEISKPIEKRKSSENQSQSALKRKKQAELSISNDFQESVISEERDSENSEEIKSENSEARDRSNSPNKASHKKNGSRSPRKNSFINEIQQEEAKNNISKEKKETRAEIAANKVKLKGEAIRNSIAEKDHSKSKKQYGINRRNINPSFLKTVEENAIINENPNDIEIFLNDAQQIQNDYIKNDFEENYNNKDEYANIQKNSNDTDWQRNQENYIHSEDYKEVPYSKNDKENVRYQRRFSESNLNEIESKIDKINLKINSLTNDEENIDYPQRRSPGMEQEFEKQVINKIIDDNEFTDQNIPKNQRRGSIELCTKKRNTNQNSLNNKSYKTASTQNDENHTKLIDFLKKENSYQKDSQKSQENLVNNIVKQLKEQQQQINYLVSKVNYMEPYVNSMYQMNMNNRMYNFNHQMPAQTYPVVIQQQPILNPGMNMTQPFDNNMAQMNLHHQVKMMEKNIQNQDRQNTPCFSTSPYNNSKKHINPIDKLKADKSSELYNNVVSLNTLDKNAKWKARKDKVTPNEPENPEISNKTSHKDIYDDLINKNMLKNKSDIQALPKNYKNNDFIENPRNDNWSGKKNNIKTDDISEDFYQKNDSDLENLANQKNVTKKKEEINYHTKSSVEEELPVNRSNNKNHNRKKLIHSKNTNVYEVDDSTDMDANNNIFNMEINEILYKNLRNKNTSFWLDLLSNHGVLRQFVKINQENLKRLFDRLLDLMLENPKNCQVCMLWIERYIEHGKINSLEDAYQVYNIIAKMTSDKYIRIKKELKFIIDDLTK